MTDFRKAGAEILRIIQSSVDPALEAGRVLLYGKDSGGTTKLFMRDSAGTVTEVGGGGGGGAGSLAITTEAPVNPISLSTEGTLDWFASTQAANPSAIASNVLHSKATGKWLKDGLVWIHGSAAVSAATFANNDRNCALGDSTGNTTAIGTTTGYLSTGGAATGWGYRIRVPASATQSRVLRLHEGHFSCELTVTATLDDGSAPQVQASINRTAGTSGNAIFKITYQGGSDTYLNVMALVTLNNGSSPNTGISAITVNTV